MLLPILIEQNLLALVGVKSNKSNKSLIINLGNERIKSTVIVLPCPEGLKVILINKSFYSNSDFFYCETLKLIS